MSGSVQALIGGYKAPVGGALSASASPASTTGFTTVSGGTATSDLVTITASGGTSPYTYSWARLSGDTVTTISSSTSSGVSWSATVSAANPSRLSTWRCTVTDAVSATTTVDVNVDLEYTP